MNGDSEHPYAVTAATPEGWQSVSYNAPFCLANNWITASLDITSSTGPNSNSGINAFPSSGNTFVSGLYATNDESLLFFHEGIEQVVYGLVPGATYDVCFDQAIIAQNSVSDRTGAWEAFVDSTSIGVSELSTNYGLAYGDPAVEWESRCISFQASSDNHLMSFLSWDNDTLTQFIRTGNAGALRMGIDKIYIPPCYIPVDLPDTVFLCGPSDLVEVAPVIPQGSIGLWSNGTESLNIEISEPGMYSLEAALLACIGRDSVMVVEIPIPTPSRFHSIH